MKKERKKLSKEKILIAVAVIVALIAAAAVACAYFIGFDNIKSVYYGVKYDKAEITDMQKESSERLKSELDKYEGIEAREPTEDEVKAVEAGEINEEQLVDIISSGTDLDTYRENNYNVDSPAQQTETLVTESTAEEQPQKSDSDAACDEEVSRIVAKMYVLRSSYSGSLSSLLSQAYSEYKAGGSKSEIASRYIGMGQALEAQCDGNVDALMSELSGVLTSHGRSTELVDSIYQSYAGEKQYTKAYYMSMYLNG